MGKDSAKGGKSIKLGSGACEFETGNSQPSLQGKGWEKEKMSYGRTIKPYCGAGNPRAKECPFQVEGPEISRPPTQQSEW